MVDRYQILNEEILEIGCGDGYFISQFPNSNVKIGIEPSAEAGICAEDDVKIINGYFDPEINYDLKPSVVMMRQVLEHLDNPMRILKKINEILINEGIIYLEVPNATLTIEKRRIADFYYEHNFYYTPVSICNILSKTGFHVLEMREEYSREILSIVARKSNNQSIDYEAKLKKFNDYIRNNNDKKIIGWGAAGNGPSILNQADNSIKYIEYVVDSDERKQGKYIPGSGQEIISPNALKLISPDILIIFTQFHKIEIKKEAEKLLGNNIIIITVEDICNGNN